jgi:flagellar biosynthesis chaperone FliJ
MTTVKPEAVRAPTPAAKRAQALRESRRRDSRTKRDQVTAALSTMLAAGDQISFASVARRAGVSTWLAYAPGVREQIDTAITQQTNADKGQAPSESSRALRTDLELARQEIRRLRGERDELRGHLQSTLGRQLTNLSAAPLVERIATLSQELTQAGRANQDLTDQVNRLQDDLDAARRALRQMIKNTAADSTVS